MKKLNSSEANKLLKKLNDEKTRLLRLEQQSTTFVAAVEENIEDVRPEYGP